MSLNLEFKATPSPTEKHTRKRTLNFTWITYWSQNIINGIYQGNLLFGILHPSEWLQVQHFMKSRFAATKMPRHLWLQQSWNDSQRIKSKQYPVAPCQLGSRCRASTLTQRGRKSLLGRSLLSLTTIPSGVKICVCEYLLTRIPVRQKNSDFLCQQLNTKFNENIEVIE